MENKNFYITYFLEKGDLEARGINIEAKNMIASLIKFEHYSIEKEITPIILNCVNITLMREIKS